MVALGTAILFVGIELVINEPEIDLRATSRILRANLLQSNLTTLYGLHIPRVQNTNVR
jgi:hypothetical protein